LVVDEEYTYRKKFVIFINIYELCYLSLKHVLFLFVGRLLIKRTCNHYRSEIYEGRG